MDQRRPEKVESGGFQSTAVKTNREVALPGLARTIVRARLRLPEKSLVIHRIKRKSAKAGSAFFKLQHFQAGGLQPLDNHF